MADHNFKTSTKKVTLNKARDIGSAKKLNYLSEKIKLISTNGLTKFLINKYSILSDANFFSLDELQNYLVFISIAKYQFLVLQLKCIYRHLKKYQEKVSKIHPHEIIVFFQSD